MKLLSSIPMHSLKLSLSGTSRRLHQNAFRLPRMALSSPNHIKDLPKQKSSETEHNKMYKALLVDVGGTLLQTAKPVEETYAQYCLKYGLDVSPKEIKQGFKKAFADPWPERLRYEGDGKVFWRYAVTQATGCDDQQLFEELYNHYAKGEAWKLPDGTVNSLVRLKDSGVKLGVISNFDSRLRPILQELNIAYLFDAIIVSAEVGYEKPSPEIFQVALRELSVKPEETVVVGDDPTADVAGAQALAMNAWLWKKDVLSFEEIANRILGVES